MHKLFFMAVLAFALLPSAWAENSYVDNTLCYTCHKPQKQTFQAGAHGRAIAGDETAGCQSCHGPGAAHKEAAAKDNAAGPGNIESFKKAVREPGETNRICLTCHEKNKQHADWSGSKHDMGGVNCTDCHQIHVAGDTVRPGVCFTCHQAKRSQVENSTNPMMPKRDGSRECAKCHDVHGGGAGPSLLKSATVNDTCYDCHSEKRGPFLWEHPPVRQDCATCHDPHGTPNENLLKMRAPYLCQDCHSASYHPSSLYSGSSLATGDAHVVGKSCVNCHSMIHGSNHPSGGRFQR